MLSAKVMVSVDIVYLFLSGKGAVVSAPVRVEVRLKPLALT
jgi:hypothetical protein